jgi:hypothetical protein
VQPGVHAELLPRQDRPEAAEVLPLHLLEPDQVDLVLAQQAGRHLAAAVARAEATATSGVVGAEDVEARGRELDPRQRPGARRGGGARRGADARRRDRVLGHGRAGDGQAAPEDEYGGHGGERGTSGATCGGSTLGRAGAIVT